jgi:hypothetical protein
MLGIYRKQGKKASSCSLRPGYRGNAPRQADLDLSSVAESVRSALALCTCVHSRTLRRRKTVARSETTYA